MLGTPISTGMPFGSISVNGASGRADLTFTATGPKGGGRVFLEAVKKQGVWSITRLAVKVDDREGVINLISPANTT